MRLVEITKFLAVSSEVRTLDEIFSQETGFDAWVNEYGDLPGMCNMPNPDEAIDKALGIVQQQIFLTIKFHTGER